MNRLNTRIQIKGIKYPVIIFLMLSIFIFKFEVSESNFILNLNNIKYYQLAMSPTDCGSAEALLNDAISHEQYVGKMVAVALGCFESVVNDLHLAYPSLGKNRFQVLVWNLGFYLFSHNQFNDAVNIWNYDEGIRTKVIENLLEKGNQSEKDDNEKDAEKYYRIRSMLGGSPDYMEFLGDFYLRHGAEEKAKQTFIGGAEASTPYMKAYLYGRIAEINKEWEKAAQYYGESLNLNRNFINSSIRFAKLNAFILNEKKPAISICKGVVQQFPQNYACYEILGDIYKQLGEPDEAIRWFEKGIRSVKDEHQASYQSLFYGKIGHIFIENDEYDQAKSYFLLALDYLTDNGNAYDGLARIEEQKGNYLEAAKLLNAAISAQQKRNLTIPFQWYQRLGYYYERVGFLENALFYYQEAIKNDPGNIEIQKHIDDLRIAP